MATILDSEYQCPTCRQRVGVKSITGKLVKTTMVLLACNHSAIVRSDPEDTSMHQKHQEKTKACAVCDSKFQAYIDDALTDFCMACRHKYRINSPKDAEEWLQELEQLKPGERETYMDFAMAQAATAAAARGTTHHQVQAGVTRHMPPVPKMAPEKIAEIVRGQVDYRHAHDPRPLDAMTSYVIHKGGVMEVRHNEIADISIVPKDVMGMLTVLTPGVKMNLPPLPYTFLSQTVSFFREVCKRASTSSEAIVQFFWDRADQQWLIHIPEQDVSGASVVHTAGFDAEMAKLDDGTLRYIHGMDIHSHGSSMGGFWSATDNADEEKAPEGRMFGVIGKVNDAMPDWKWRMRAREGFIDLTVSSIFDMSGADDIPFHVPLSVLLNADKQDGQGRVMLAFPVDAFQAATHPEAWHEKIKKFQGQRGGHQGAGGHSQQAGFFPVGGHGHTTPMKGTNGAVIDGYIYIMNADRTLLEEYKVDKGLKGDRTGFTVALTAAAAAENAAHTP